MIYVDMFKMPTDDKKLNCKFKQCTHCKFYVCELIKEYSLIELENSCVLTGYSLVECGMKYVANGIGDHFKINIKYDYKIEEDTKNRWEPIQPVFISAQTGTGKNHFIENTLLPYIRQLNHKNRTDQKVLILSNRIALRLQIKDRIKYGMDIQDFEQNKIYSYGRFADVISYQSLLNKANYLKKVQKDKYASRRYIFVICDEAHFLHPMLCSTLIPKKFYLQ